MTDKETEYEPIKHPARPLYDKMPDERVRECSKALQGLSPDEAKRAVRLAVAGGATDKFFSRLFQFATSETLQWLCPLVHEIRCIPPEQLVWDPKIFNGNEEIIDFYTLVPGRPEMDMATFITEMNSALEQTAVKDKQKK